MKFRHFVQFQVVILAFSGGAVGAATTFAGESIPLPRARPEVAQAAPDAVKPADAATVPTPRGRPDAPAATAAPDVETPLPPEKPATPSPPLPAARPATPEVPLPAARPGQKPPSVGDGEQDQDGVPNDAAMPEAPVPAEPRTPLFAEDAMSPACDAIEEGRVSGRPLKPIEDPAGCVVPEVYAISSVGTERAVVLVQEATLTCAMADHLDSFVEEVVEPEAREILKSDLVGLGIAGSYVCRTRNNQTGGSPSEHGKANAIDVARFVLADGRTISVTEHWKDDGEAGQFLHAVHDKACGPFTTVIGPDGDEFHQDHFHLDLQPRGKDGQTTFCQ